MSKAQSNEVAVFEAPTDLAARQERVGQGSQNVSAADMAIPRIKLLQLISEEVQPAKPKYVEGATPGLLMNSVTRELATSLFVVNLHFSRKTVVWKKRKAGGGMFGTYESEAEAIQALESAGEVVAQYDISENPTHLLMVLSDTGEPKGVAILDMPGVKVRVSKTWNTLINDEEKAGSPRFSCVWQLGVVAEDNANGPYFNLTAKLVAKAPDSIYEAAAAAYDAFFGGQSDQAA